MLTSGGAKATPRAATGRLALEGRRSFLNSIGRAIGAVALGGGLWKIRCPALKKETQAENVVEGLEPPLRVHAARKGLFYGAATHRSRLQFDGAFASRLAEECALLVPERELKWGALRPSQEQFNFTDGDWLLSFATAHGLKVRGHTLVWHAHLPQWFEGTVSSKNAELVLTEHITTVVRQYAGKLHSWDVVNEGVHPEDGRKDGLRKTPWLEFLGPDYLEVAFRAAAKADRNVMLVYNETRLDYDIPQERRRQDVVVRLLGDLKAAGVPIHALGIQAHLRAEETRFAPKSLRRFLRDVASLGLKILITEMDVSDGALPADIDLRDKAVARIYEEYLTAALDERAVIGVLTWGLSDRYTWISGARPRRDGSPVRPLPLDANLRRKACWQAIARAFDGASDRSTLSAP